MRDIKFPPFVMIFSNFSAIEMPKGLFQETSVSPLKITTKFSTNRLTQEFSLLPGGNSRLDGLRSVKYLKFHEGVSDPDPLACPPKNGRENKRVDEFTRTVIIS